MAKKATYSQRPICAAVALEALYRIVRSRGFSGDRLRFLKLGDQIVAAMRERGELPAN